ncbi:MAG: UDP-N-acetylmuramyl-tripeptide synthetase, partial [Candidatus Krumholzibacteriota bacterium]|nr:UDP-N-acetylmuramyl-tripeptide synthetase [Candidatus Krumholzibacteriota bacterium]
MQSAIPVTGTAMKLVDLIATLNSSSVSGGGTAIDEIAIGGIAIDSRAVETDDLFVALRGTISDGHDFVDTAVARGAAAVVVEDPLEGIGVPVVTVPDSAKALALIAARFHGDPASRMVLCGVTGTNGKSTTAILTRAIVNASRVGKMGLIGTLGWGSDALRESTHTTPDALTLHRFFVEMEDAGVFGVVMEVSSHAVRQHRAWGMDFEVGILTNVTHDHLDYHIDYDDYRGSKAEFCHSLAGGERRKRDGSLVYWRDDAESRKIGEAFPARRVSVGMSDEADVFAFDVRSSLEGTRMTLRLQTGEEVHVSTGLLGSFVAINSSLAAAAAVELGADAAAVRAGLEATSRIPGRFEAIGGGKKPTVVVDYAHTADSME